MMVSQEGAAFVMVRIESVPVDQAMAGHIAGIVNRAFSVEAWFVDGDRITPDGTRRLAADEAGQFFVAYADDGSPIGCVYTEIRDAGVGYFGLLSVAAEHRGAGVGDQLVQRAEAYLKSRGRHTIEITVVDLRTELFPYYERRGYHVDGRTLPFPRVAKLPCTLIYMSKAL